MTNHLAAELRGILDDLPGLPPPGLGAFRERLERLVEHVEHVERLGAEPVEVEPASCSRSPLTAEQEIRSDALGHAIAWVGDHWIGGTRDRNGILDVAADLADWIRTGGRPA